MQITIYSTSTCPYGKELKDYLDSKNIVFTEKLIDKDDAIKAEMSEITGGFLGVPYILINFDDGRVEKIVGFDKGKIDSLLAAV